jgi:4'-phosphopantetheinyl transferase
MTLREGDVHVWRVRLDVPRASLEAHARSLGPDEEARALRFRFDEDRSRFVVAHGALRVILGMYLGIDPESVGITRGAGNKPELSNAAHQLQFNLAHAAGVALVAVTRGRAVGVDVEHITPIETDVVAARFFSKRERRELSSLPIEEREREFFRIWTLREAYAKATGGGLREALEISTDAARCRWHLHSVSALAGFAASLVVERPAGVPKLRSWPSLQLRTD